MISRRGFFGALATAAVGACVATKIPTAFLPQPVRYRAACEYLREHYNAWSMRQVRAWAAEWAAEMSRSFSDSIPGVLLVGQSLFESYEGELTPVEYFGSPKEPEFARCLRFKGASVVSEDSLTGLSGWDVMVLSREQWAKARSQMKAGKPLEWVRNVA